MAVQDHYVHVSSGECSRPEPIGAFGTGSFVGGPMDCRNCGVPCRTVTHTQGKWNAEPVIGENTLTYYRVKDAAGDGIAGVYLRGRHRGESKANARLIATAPRLLTVAQTAELMLRNGAVERPLDEVVSDVRALLLDAIAEATT